jgi:hypothetical protein
MSHLYTISWRFPTINTIYFFFPREDIDFEIGHLTRQRRAMSEQKLLQLPGVKPVPSNAERERLLKPARLRERVAKSAAAERSARLLADFEQAACRHLPFRQQRNLEQGRSRCRLCL